MGTAGTMKKKVSMSSKSKEPELQVYCRKCMKTKSSKEFYTKVDDLDANGFMSICRECCGEVYNNSYAVERSFERALLRTCKILNLAWVPNAVDATKNHMDKGKARGQEEFSVFGIYKSKLMTLANLAGDKALTFEEYPTVESLYVDDVAESDKDLSKVWGTKIENDELLWLEEEYAKWIKNPNAEVDHNIEVLLRLICLKQLEIRRKQQSAQSYDAEAKALQELMKNTALTPLTQRASDVGNDSLCIGNIIKEMETKEPADVFEDQSLFKDYDNIEGKYINPYIVRPLKTFTTGIKDFDVNYRGEENSLNEGDE